MVGGKNGSHVTISFREKLHIKYKPWNMEHDWMKHAYKVQHSKTDGISLVHLFQRQTSFNKDYKRGPISAFIELAFFKKNNYQSFLNRSLGSDRMGT